MKYFIAFCLFVILSPSVIASADVQQDFSIKQLSDETELVGNEGIAVIFLFSEFERTIVKLKDKNNPDTEISWFIRNVGDENIVKLPAGEYYISEIVAGKEETFIKPSIAHKIFYAGFKWGSDNHLSMHYLNDVKNKEPNAPKFSVIKNKINYLGHMRILDEREIIVKDTESSNIEVAKVRTPKLFAKYDYVKNVKATFWEPVQYEEPSEYESPFDE